MSMIDALLLDAEPLDIWMAARTDGVNGAGTEDDPFDGSTRDTTVVSEISISGTGTTATVQAPSHGFQNGQLVMIAGATGANATYYNGTFAVSNKTQNTFEYTMWGTPSASAQGTLACRVDPYQFDAIMRAVPVVVTSLGNTGTLTVTAGVNGHGFSTGNLVMISGVTGPSAQDYNGTFQITRLNENAFSYTTTQASQYPPEGDNITCRLARSGPVTGPLRQAVPVSVHLGPGAFETRGWTPPAAATSWGARSGMKILGSGMDVTVLKLVAAMADNNPNDYIAILGSFEPEPTSFEASDFTVDCDIAGQPSPSVACGAVSISGSHTRLRRIRAINFGTQTVGAECFVLSAAGATPAQEAADCVIEDCVMDQPGLNNARETSVLCLISTEWPSGEMGYHRACVIRNCFVNLEFRENPVPIASISVAGTVATVTTRLPHGRSENAWVRISGAVMNGEPDNSFNGSYPISDVSTYGFKYTPNPPPAGNPTGDMWVGRFPSLLVQITGLSKSDDLGGGTYRVTLTTLTPHFRVPGDKVEVQLIYEQSNPANPATLSSLYNGSFKVEEVAGADVLEYDIKTETAPPDVSSLDNALIGTDFHGLVADGGTATVVEGNRVLNCTTGGPYHDTWNSRDQITRKNYYRVTIGPYQSLARVSSTSDMTLLASLTTTGPGSTTAVATSSDPHGFSVEDPVVISGVTGPGAQDPALFNGTWKITAVPTAYTFEYDTHEHQAQGTPSENPEGTPGYATADRQRRLTSLMAAPEGGVYVATATFASAHHLSAGEFVYISKASLPGYNGYFRMTSPPPSPTSFNYTLGPTNPGGDSISGYFGRVWGGGRGIVENNIIEVFPAQTRFFPPRGICMGWAALDAPTTRTPETVMRRNVIRHVDGAPDAVPLEDYSRGIFASAAGALMVEENVVDLDIATPPIEYADVRSPHFFANRTSGGVLVQGSYYPSGPKASELSITVEDAEGLAL